MNFDTRNVNYMTMMFYSAASFNQSVSHFDTSNVVEMNHMFYNARSFNWPVFGFATSFNQPIDFQADALTTTALMFERASSFNQSVVLRNSTNLVSVQRMFQNVSTCFTAL